MKSHNSPLLSVIAGAISGILFLGILGRLFTMIFEFTARNNSNISISGIFEVIIIGLIVGAIGGFLYYIFSNSKQRSKTVNGLMTGFIMFLSTTIFMFLTGRASLGIAPVYLMLAAAVIVFALYGLFLPKFLSWFIKYRESLERKKVPQGR